MIGTTKTKPPSPQGDSFNLLIPPSKEDYPEGSLLVSFLCGKENKENMARKCLKLPI
jgi:hypothetical protein